MSNELYIWGYSHNKPIYARDHHEPNDSRTAFQTDSKGNLGRKAKKLGLSTRGKVLDYENDKKNIQFATQQATRPNWMNDPEWSKPIEQYQREEQDAADDQAAVGSYMNQQDAAEEESFTFQPGDLRDSTYSGSDDLYGP